MAKYPVYLPGNASIFVGHVWQDEQELWHSGLRPDADLARRRIYTEGYAGGPFATRYDAEYDVIDAWERAVYW